jgi:hypothetical protein
VNPIPHTPYIPVASVARGPPSAVHELQKRKDALRKQQLEHQTQLLSLLSSPTLDKDTRQMLIKQLNELTAALEASLKKDSSTLEQVVHKKQAEETSPKTTVAPPLDSASSEVVLPPSSNDESKPEGEPQDQFDRLKGTLEYLREEANKLGYEPDAVASQHPVPTHGYAPRGGYRGRGWRGRGYYPVPRGSWAGRGRGGHRLASAADLVIDHRTSTIAINNTPAALNNEQSLRSHFQSYGTVENVEIIDAATAIVQFATRRDAETVSCHSRNSLLKKTNHRTLCNFLFPRLLGEELFIKINLCLSVGKNELLLNKHH